MTDKPLMTSDEVGAFIGERVPWRQGWPSPRTLARWRSQGDGPKVTWVAGKPMYHPDDVDAWLASQQGSSQNGRSLAK